MNKKRYSRYDFLPSQKSFEPPKKEMPGWVKALSVIVGFPIIAAIAILLIVGPMFVGGWILPQGNGNAMLIVAALWAVEIVGIVFAAKRLVK